jgi:hypothetical protein
MNNNIVIFPNKKPGFQFKNRINVSSRLPRTNTVMAVSRRMWEVLRPVLFILLYWLRMPVVGFFRLISGPALFFCFVGYFMFPDGHPHKWGVLSFLAGLSLAAFVLSFLFDSLLVSLSPDNFFIER